MRRVASNRLSLIFDESEWNNCFIIYTRSEFTDFVFGYFQYFSILFMFLSSLFRPIIFSKIYILTILNFKNSFANL